MNQYVSKNKIASFYGFAFLISWISWFSMSFVYDGNQPGLFVYAFSTLGGAGPLLSLFILQKLTNKEVSVKNILSQIRIREAKIKWVIPAVFAIPTMAVLGNLGYYAIGKEEELQLINEGPDELGGFVILVMVLHFVASLVTSPLFEEPGWRGFALGKLQKRWGRTAGSLLVGVLWWAWHQPMNITFGLIPSMFSTTTMIARSFAIDSLFNLSDKNLFIAMLAHQSMGTVITFLYQGNENWLQLILTFLFVIFLRILENTKGEQIKNLPNPA